MVTWSADSVCLRSERFDLESIARTLYLRTCRTDFRQPGFCLLNVGRQIDSVEFRQTMVNLKREMATIHQAETGNTLVYLSAARFDQQTTTKPHLDAGPDECFLMLGYEPSDVGAQLEIADFAKCAHDMNLTPREFLRRHNPMFHSGQQMLRPYTTRLPCFSNLDYQIVCINNSSADFCGDTPRWLGTMHTATIPRPDESLRRVINSTMIASARRGSPDVIDEDAVRDFVQTAVVRRKGYDKTHLSDEG